MKKHVRCITINTDASYYREEGVGGYAFYIVCDLFKIQKGGYFKTTPDSSQEAEIRCMANALHTLAAQTELPSVDLIVVNSDCLHVFQQVGLRKAGTGKMVAQLLRTVRKKLAKGTTLPRYEFRHVKAHSDAKDARSWVNSWCDREAKKWAKLRIQQLK